MNDNQEKAKFITYAHSFQTVSRPGLERITHMLSLLGHPERTLSCIHIAGTNGKGSVTAFLDAILSTAGYRVGRYTSPNLVRVNERMKVAGKDIDDEEMQELFSELASVAEETERVRGGDKLTQFEIWTAAAFLWFSRKKCDYVVLETGMGGELDATNAIESNVAAVLTRIDLDHTEYLGDTVREITRTKCGIFKKDSTLRAVFTVPQEDDSLAVIREQASEKGLDAIVVSPLASEESNGLFETVNYRGKRITLSLAGVHQCENAALAVAVAEKMGVSEEAIIRGLSEARHPGRLELLQREPLLLYDGAHNPNGVRALAKTLERAGISRLTVIFACMHDKDVRESLLLLRNFASRFIFTTVQNNPRAETPTGLQARAQALGIQGETAETLAEAIGMLDSENALICGSLYLYADLPSR